MPCAPHILKAVVLIAINLFRSTNCKMMSCAASAGTEAISYGSPTTVLAILRLKDADELGKGIRQLTLLCDFTDKYASAFRVRDGNWCVRLGIELYFRLAQEGRELRGAFRE